MHVAAFPASPALRPQISPCEHQSPAIATMDIPSVRYDHVAQEDQSPDHADPIFAVEPVGAAIIGELRCEKIAVGMDGAPQIVHVGEQAKNLAAVSSGAAQDDRKREPRAFDSVLRVVRIMQANNLGTRSPGVPASCFATWSGSTKGRQMAD
jgi:hypothetical protein